MLSGLRRSEMLTAVLIFVLLLGVPPVFAGVQGGANSCAADEAGISLNCTAEDVRVASVDLLDVVDGCTAVGDTAVAKMLLNLEINASARYDIGVYIGTDGGDAQSGSCFKEYLPLPLVASPTDADLSTGYGTYWSGGSDGDQCGDAEQNDIVVDPVKRLLSEAGQAATPEAVTLSCRDTDADGFLDFDYCSGWRNNTKFTCNDISGAGIVQTAAKCKCDTVNIGIPVPSAAAPPTMELRKTVMVAGGTCGVDDVDLLNVATGTTVQYCYELSNTSLADAWQVELLDDNATPGNAADDFTIALTGLVELEGNGDADDLAAGATVTGVSGPIVLPVPETRINLATATAIDPATSAPLADADPATVTAADIGSVGNIACASGADAASGATVQGCDSLLVEVRLEPPSITVTKTVMPAAGTCGVDDVDVLEILVGGSVRYCYEVAAGGVPETHESVYDVVLVDDAGTPGDLVDDFFVSLDGLIDISGDGDPDDLTAGGVATGISDVFVVGAPSTIDNVATVTGTDPADSSVLTDSDTARVTAANRPSGISVGKTAMPAAGTCGVDDIDNLFVTTSSPDVVYCYVVRADGTPGTFDPVYNITLVDDMGTPGDVSDDQTIVLSPLSDLDGGGSANDLEAGGVARGQSSVVAVP